MITRVTDYPGYLLRLCEGPATDKAILFLHGFPANRGVKNLDIADCVQREFQHDTYLLHYKGLGESPGAFKFTDSIEEASRVVELIMRDKAHKELRIVGHSWGGLVATNIAQRHPDKVRSIVLLSPFCGVKKSEPLYDWFINRAREEFNIFGDQTEADVIRDFDFVLENHLPKFMAPKLADHIKVSVIQAGRDDVTPPSNMKATLPFFKTVPTYVELDQDHSFSQSRKELAETVAKFIQL
jgi:pimeloyl-ACP methyl ester carboxylesterase